MKNICIIGNSGKLLQEALGSKIDLCDIVVRIQKFKTQGFEKHVGTKTSIFSSAWRGIDRVKKCIEFGNIDVNSTEMWCPHPLEGMRMRTCIGVLGKTEASKCKSPSVNLYNSIVKNLYSNYWTNKPSSGIMTILLARELYPNDKIFICGFDSFLEKDHYYDLNLIDRIEPGYTHPGHNWEGEWNYIQEMINNKEIFHIRDIE